MKNAMDIQKRNLLHLFGLIRQNPDLPIVPMVNYEVVADDCAMYRIPHHAETAVP